MNDSQRQDFAPARPASPYSAAPLDALKVINDAIIGCHNLVDLCKARQLFANLIAATSLYLRTAEVAVWTPAIVESLRPFFNLDKPSPDDNAMDRLKAALSDANGDLRTELEKPSAPALPSPALLSNDEYDAMEAFRIEFQPRSKKMGFRDWKEVLTVAWLHDWREQWGTLRRVRNTIGIQEAFAAFDTITQERREQRGQPKIVEASTPTLEELLHLQRNMTNGPWAVGSICGASDDERAIETKNGETVCTVLKIADDPNFPDECPNRETNALVIAKLPDILAEVIQLRTERILK